MKKRNKMLAAFLSAALMMTPVTFAYAGAAPDGQSSAQTMYGTAFDTWKAEQWINGGLSQDWTQVSMTPGADESSMNFAWYSKTGEPTSLKYGLKSDLSDAKDVTVKAVETSQTDKNGVSYTSNKVQLTELLPETTYYYQVEGKAIKSFKTGDSEQFTFAFVGDPQIGSSNPLKGADTEEFYNAQSDAVANDSYNWGKTLERIQNSGSDFVVSAGDQIQTTKKKSPNKDKTTSEIEYAGYLSPAALTSLPVATTVGNHDADNENYQYHFNVPNLSNLGDNGIVGGDYYFTYGDVLFMMLNTQGTDNAEHIEFIENTVSKNADCKWKVVTLHQDIYGSAEHSNEPEIVNLRYALAPAFKANGVDVVLSGHDHAYSRTKFINSDTEVKTTTYSDDAFDEMLEKDIDYNGTETLFTAPGNISDETTDDDEKTYLNYLKSIMDVNNITDDSTTYAVNPSGILYLTAGSSSGSKHYDLVARQQSYVASRWQEDVPTYSLIDVTETTMTINTYRADNGSKIDDTVTIVKTADTAALNTEIDKINAEIENGTLAEADYTSESWTAFQTALENAKKVNEDVTAIQAEKDSALENLIAARNGLAKKPVETSKEDNKDTNATTNQNGNGSGNGQTADQNKSGNTQPVIQDKNVKTADKAANTSTSKVKTADENDAVLYAIICALGIGAVGTAFYYRRKYEKESIS